tara:strand:- start:232 stop:510 length:279 start_codon:yes stop_codon:yes gene_type:complete
MEDIIAQIKQTTREDFLNYNQNIHQNWAKERRDDVDRSNVKRRKINHSSNVEDILLKKDVEDAESVAGKMSQPLAVSDHSSTATQPISKQHP